MTFRSDWKKESKKILGKLRHSIPPYKSSKYLRWVKDKYPEYEIHHILASHLGKKTTDYLVVPLSPEVHRKIQREYYKYTPMHLMPAVLVLLAYLKATYNVDMAVPDTLDKVRELVELAYKYDKNKE